MVKSIQLLSMLEACLGIATRTGRPIVDPYFLCQVWFFCHFVSHFISSLVFRIVFCNVIYFAGKWRTTRRPFVSANPARSTTTPGPFTTTRRPPVTILKTNLDTTLSLENGLKISNRGRKLVGSPNNFNHFTSTTAMPNYAQDTTPDTTEIYSFFNTNTNKNPGFNLFNSTVYQPSTLPVVSYSTVIVHSPSPKPTESPLRTTRYLV